MSKIQSLFVKYIYADHNNSPSVKKALKKVLKKLEFDVNASGLNVGAGKTRLHPKMKNLDVFSGPNIDIVAFAESIPVEDGTFDVVVTQETLEHVQDPFKAMSELHRILKPTGTLYCQLPFIIGYHPGPHDFWRFSKEGIEELAKRVGFKIIERGISINGGSGYYRISVEFFSVLVSCILPILYKPSKAFFSLLLYPFKAFDFIFKFSQQRDRIPGGYFIIAEK
jgi:SAM-dependent methyltransferase